MGRRHRGRRLQNPLGRPGRLGDPWSHVAVCRLELGGHEFVNACLVSGLQGLIAKEKSALPKMPSSAPKMPGGLSSGWSGSASTTELTQGSEPTPAVGAARWINIIAVLVIITMVTGSLVQQFGYGQPPCALCVIERSALIGMAIGPIMNLLMGLSPKHYAITIIAALVGSAAAGKQAIGKANGTLVLDPNDVVMSIPLFYWALSIFVAGILVCAFILLWTASWQTDDEGLLHHRGPARVATFTVIGWLFSYVCLTIWQVLVNCGVSACPTNPASTGAQSVQFTFAITRNGTETTLISIPGFITILLALGLLSLLFGIILNRRMGKAEDRRSREQRQ